MGYDDMEQDTAVLKDEMETSLIVTIPEHVLHQLRWEVGDNIRLELTGDGSVLIKKD